MYTKYQTKYFFEQLTLKRPSNDGSIYNAIAGARVDLNPHQVNAALFASKSPLSQGVILADEVGLGKTIEAGICVAQNWAEHKRNILLIVPASLRSQWLFELETKFFIQSIILESKNFNFEIKKGNSNPFKQQKVVICSYNFASMKDDYVKDVNWDLAVLDEAHRLRNVYRVSSKMSNKLKSSLVNKKKILLTATPLQNNLMELYGLVSFIDDRVFSDPKSFRDKFVNTTDEDVRNIFLKARIKPFFTRTLRKQVTEYIPFTNRVALLQEYYPTKSEELLYNEISDYLRSERLFALPNSQRSLMTLVMRKLLASSTYAISGTIESLITRLELKIDGHESELVLSDYDVFDEIEEEIEEVENVEIDIVDDDNIKLLMKEELDRLKGYFELSKSIKINAKGQNLLIALQKGFDETERLGGLRKAVIFTESRRTQNYLFNLLSENGYEDSIVLLNGSNNDDTSIEVYNEWINMHGLDGFITGSKQSDVKTAIVESFKNKTNILIGTEAAAEGINLQFCSLVVNYDMPWNPQRIEQRIGRCHRYGQKNDVVVLNFLNMGNEVDIRIYELLDQKFKLFNGLFGSSDEILGTLDSGVDFEKRIAEIYQKCKTAEEIKNAFNLLQHDLKDDIDITMKTAKSTLLENFDEDVAQNLRSSHDEVIRKVGQFEEWLYYFVVSQNRRDVIPLENFRFSYNGNLKFNGIYNVNWKESESLGERFFRLDDDLCQQLIFDFNKELPQTSYLEFDYSKSGRKISFLDNNLNKKGWMQLSKLINIGVDKDEYLVIGARLDDGTLVETEIVNKLMEIPASEELTFSTEIPLDLSELMRDVVRDKWNKIENINRRYFLEECAKLDAWSEEKKETLQRDIKDLDKSIKETVKELNSNIEMYSLEELIEKKSEITKMKRTREKNRKDYFDEQDKIDEENEKLQNEMRIVVLGKKENFNIFTIRFNVI